MDLATFRATFPEFSQVPDEMIEAQIIRATSALRADIFGTEIETAISLYAAHLLVLAPGGQSARIVPPKGGDLPLGGETTYGRQFLYLRGAATTMRRFF